MKHRNLTTLLLVTLAALMLVGCSLAYADHLVPGGSPSAQLTQEEAWSIALTHAEVSADQISRKRIEFDYDDGIPEYELEFYAGSTEYDYEIHAETGAILHWDVDREDRPAAVTEPAATVPAGVISREEAENIALAHAGFTRDQISRLRTELDRDDGVTEYEIEFHAGSTEYDYSIHAETGDIRSWNKDTND